MSVALVDVLREKSSLEASQFSEALCDLVDRAEVQHDKYTPMGRLMLIVQDGVPRMFRGPEEPTELWVLTNLGWLTMDLAE